MEEDNNTYTVQRQEKKENNEKNAKSDKSKKNEISSDLYNRRILILVIAAIALVVVLGVVLGKYAGMRSANKDDGSSSSSSSQEEEQSSDEPSSEEQPSELYSAGEYYVSTGNSSLKFRKDHTLNSDVILEIKDGTKVTITEIYHDENASNESVEYWGKTTYYGYDGWLAMSYLKNAYSDSIITPEELSSSENSSGEAPSSEGSSSEEPGSSAEGTTAAPSTPYTPGDYKVATEGSTLTFRKSASASSDVIMSIDYGVKVTVTRVVDAGGTNEVTRYWGEISYLGYTGYVSMYYLEKVS